MSFMQPRYLQAMVSDAIGRGVEQQKKHDFQFALTLLEGKWKIPILRQLRNGPVRLGELRRKLAPISKKVLNQRLRQMASDRLIVRSDFAGRVPHVEYSLANPFGSAVLSLLEMMAWWAAHNLPSTGDEHVPLYGVESRF